VRLRFVAVRLIVISALVDGGYFLHPAPPVAVIEVKNGF
jgi:hypothetical protein